MNGCEKSYTHPSSLRKHMKSHGKHYPHLLKCSTSSSFMDYQKDCHTPTPPSSKHLNGSMVHSAESGFDEDSKSNLSSSPLAITSGSTVQSINYTPSLMMRSNPSLLLNSNSTGSSNNYGQLLSTAASEYANSASCLTPHPTYPPVSSGATSLSDWGKLSSSMAIPSSMPTPPSNGSSPTSSSTHHPNSSSSNHHSSLSHHSHLNTMSFNTHLNYTSSHFPAASY